MLTWLFIVSGMVACYPAPAKAAIHAQSQRIERVASARAIEQTAQLTSQISATLTVQVVGTSFDLLLLDLQDHGAIPSRLWQPLQQAHPTASSIHRWPTYTDIPSHRPRGPPLA